MSVDGDGVCSTGSDGCTCGIAICEDIDSDFGSHDVHIRIKLKPTVRVVFEDVLQLLEVVSGASSIQGRHHNHYRYKSIPPIRTL